MRTWFTSDLHFGHQKVIELRGFKTDIAHDSAILRDWTEKVKPDDTVYVLGDLSCGKIADEERALDLIQPLPGIKHLIAGNHDSVTSTGRRGWKRQRRFLDVFDSVRDFARLSVAGTMTLLSHYPYADQGDGPGRGEARYLQYRLPDLGMPLIHGHTHHTEAVQAAYPRQYCVSWDAHRGLTPMKDVETWVRGLAKESNNA